MKPIIDTLLLDVDGVLLDHQRAVRVRWLAEALQVSVSSVQHALSEEGLDRAYDSGALTTSAYLSALSSRLRTTVDAPTWVGARVAASHPDPQVVRRLLDLPMPLRLGVLTNNGPLISEVIERQLPSLMPRLRGNILCSGSLGVRKPARAAFLQALEALHAAPQRTLFIDDLFVNVRGARQAGLHADTAHDARSLGRVLRRYLPD